jgi:hypothetical protein
MTVYHVATRGRAQGRFWDVNIPDIARGQAAEQAGHYYEIVSSVAELDRFFIGLLNRQFLMDELHFYTHGGTGVIALGSDSLNDRLNAFRNRSFERIFNSGAIIQFHGCNIAESGHGEIFLAEWGTVFLRGGGGDVLGNTGEGYALAGALYHPFGGWVTARVSRGGAVNLLNHSHLIPGRIRELIAALRRQIADARRAGANPGVLRLFDGAERRLARAEGLLGSPASRPAYRQIFDAWYAVEAVASTVTTLI